jgi:hypothetical protein
MTVQELENKVWEQDGIRIIVRDRSNQRSKNTNTKTQPKKNGQ